MHDLQARIYRMYADVVLDQRYLYKSPNHDWFTDLCWVIEKYFRILSKGEATVIMTDHALSVRMTDPVFDKLSECMYGTDSAVDRGVSAYVRYECDPKSEDAAALKLEYEEAFATQNLAYYNPNTLYFAVIKELMLLNHRAASLSDLFEGQVELISKKITYALTHYNFRAISVTAANNELRVEITEDLDGAERLDKLFEY